MGGKGTTPAQLGTNNQTPKAHKGFPKHTQYTHTPRDKQLHTPQTYVHTHTDNPETNTDTQMHTRGPHTDTYTFIHTHKTRDKVTKSHKP